MSSIKRGFVVSRLAVRLVLCFEEILTSHSRFGIKLLIFVGCVPRLRIVSFHILENDANDISLTISY